MLNYLQIIHIRIVTLGDSTANSAMKSSRVIAKENTINAISVREINFKSVEIQSKDGKSSKAAYA